MTQKSAVIFGATGLTGSQLLPQLLEGDAYNKVYAFCRRELDVFHQKLQVIVQSLDKLDAQAMDFLPDQLDVFLCLGTTLSKAGSKDAFRKVDYFLPLKLVNLLNNKAEHFLLISSIGAAADASSFYLSVKGQLEIDLRVLDVKKLTIFRPSLLVGPRQERRFMEDLSIKLSKLANPLFSIKFLKKYRPTESLDLATAMYRVAVNGDGLSGARTNIISSDMISNLTKP